MVPVVVLVLVIRALISLPQGNLPPRPEIVAKNHFAPGPHPPPIIALVWMAVAVVAVGRWTNPPLRLVVDAVNGKVAAIEVPAHPPSTGKTDDIDVVSTTIQSKRRTTGNVARPHRLASVVSATPREASPVNGNARIDADPVEAGNATRRGNPVNLANTETVHHRPRAVKAVNGVGVLVVRVVDRAVAPRTDIISSSKDDVVRHHRITLSTPPRAAVPLSLDVRSVRSPARPSPPSHRSSPWTPRWNDWIVRSVYSSWRLVFVVVSYANSLRATNVAGCTMPRSSRIIVRACRRVSAMWNLKRWNRSPRR